MVTAIAMKKMERIPQLMDAIDKLDTKLCDNKKLDSNIKLYPYTIPSMHKIVIACNLNDITDSKPKYEDTDNIGVLVSRLQKAIRRGKQCPNLLNDTINSRN